MVADDQTQKGREKGAGPPTKMARTWPPYGTGGEPCFTDEQGVLRKHVTQVPEGQASVNTQYKAAPPWVPIRPRRSSILTRELGFAF